MQVECCDGGALSVSGSLTFATAASAWRAAAAALDKHTPSHIELSGLREVDSAGLACVLALLARGQSRLAGMQVKNAPSALLALARVCDAESWLG